MVFGAMMHRDEAFDAIYAQYLQTSTAAATITPETWWLYVWDQRWNHLTLFSCDTFKSEQLLNSFFCCYLKDFWQTLVTFYKTQLKVGLFLGGRPGVTAAPLACKYVYVLFQGKYFY